MAIVNSFEVINLLSKNYLNQIKGGNMESVETALTGRIDENVDSNNYNNSTSIEGIETSLIG